MSHTILSVIAAMAETATVTHDDPSTRHPKKPVVTLSRDYGSGGDVIAQRLAQRLDVPLYDEQMLTEIAQRLEDDPAIIRMLDEGFGRAKDMWLYRLFSGHDISPDTYRDTLAKVVLSLGRMGGVIIGRGAHMILRDACALRVRVTGSPDICARRMSKAGYGSVEDALERGREINHARGTFVWDVFHARLSDASQFDLTLNTDRMVEFEDAAAMLESMARAIHSGRVLGG